MRVVPLRARRLSVKVTVSLWLRIVVTREPCARVRWLRALERQLTLTRPVRAIGPLTRSLPFLITAVIFVFSGLVVVVDPGAGGGGGGGPGCVFLTWTTGDVAIWLLPAASVTTRLNVCGPSATRRVSTLSVPLGCCGQGCASAKSHGLRGGGQRLPRVAAHELLLDAAGVGRGERDGDDARDRASPPRCSGDVAQRRRDAL